MPRILGFAANVRQVWSVYGCSDRLLLDAIAKRFKKKLNELTESYKTVSAKAPDAASLLAGFVAGTPPHNAWVANNIDILLLLLHYFGEPLDSEVLDRADDVFVQSLQDAAGPAVDLHALTSANPPDHIPFQPVYPGAPKARGAWGFLDRAAAEQLHAALATAAAPAGSDVATGLAELRAWCAAAIARDTGLVLFHSR